MAPESSPLGIYILDVGQGDCTFIVPPRGEGAPILFDCNDAYVAERFASNHAITHLRAVIASHLDRDHIRGIVPFLQSHFDSGRTLEMLVVGIDRPPDRGGPGHEISTLLERALAWERTPPCAGFVLEDLPVAVFTPLCAAREAYRDADYSTAEGKNREALRAAEECDHALGKILGHRFVGLCLYGSLGALYSELGQLEAATDCYARCEDAFESLQVPHRLANARGLSRSPRRGERAARRLGAVLGSRLASNAGSSSPSAAVSVACPRSRRCATTW